MIYLLILFICHFLADFTHLSRPWMLKAKAIGVPIWPIFLHGLVHGILMAAITLIFFNADAVMWVLFFQSFSHAIIDILKGRLNIWYPGLRNPSNIYHWYIFGFDQLLHTVCILYIYHVCTSHYAV